MLSPPTSSVYRSVVYFAMSFKNFAVCIASSRVGDSTMALLPTLEECSFSFSSIGIKNDAVLPEPESITSTQTSFIETQGTWDGRGARRTQTDLFEP